MSLRHVSPRNVGAGNLRLPAALAAVLLLAALLSAACGAPAVEQKAVDEGGAAVDGSPAAPAMAADEAGPAAAPDAAPDAANLRAPGAGAPPPPSPLPALNEYAEQCLRIEPPEEAAAAGPFVADCCAQLLETLRATLGALRLPAEEVGESLAAAEVAVRHLGAGAGGGDAAPRAAGAATALAELARAVAATDAADGGAAADAAALDALDAAAAAVDGDRSLGEQRDGLAAFFTRADAVVRPLARAGGV